MATLFRRLAPVEDDADQARRYFKRQRLSSLAWPGAEMQPVERFAADGSDNPILTSEYFPTKKTPQTFEVWISATNIAANGVIFELGGTNRGIALAIDGSTLILAAGGGEVASPDEGCSSTVLAVINALNHRYRIVCASIPDGPGGGSINMWVNGQIAGAAQANNGEFGGTLANNDGAVGDVQGTIIDRIPLPQRVALTGCDIISPLVVYSQGTLPQQYRNNFTLGIDTTGNGDYQNTYNSQVGG